FAEVSAALASSASLRRPIWWPVSHFEWPSQVSPATTTNVSPPATCVAMFDLSRPPMPSTLALATSQLAKPPETTLRYGPTKATTRFRGMGTVAPLCVWGLGSSRTLEERGVAPLASRRPAGGVLGCFEEALALEGHHPAEHVAAGGICVLGDEPVVFGDPAALGRRVAGQGIALQPAEE